MLIQHLHNSLMKKVEEFWDSGSLDKLLTTWKTKEWWQALIPEENIEYFYNEIFSKKIPRNAGPNKLRWGYTNLGNFNIKEAIEMLTETHRMEEVKWRKIWGGIWWPKVIAFSLLILKRCILTWDNIQARGFMDSSRCCLCETSNETINHLPDECPIAEAIWEKAQGCSKRITDIKVALI